MLIPVAPAAIAPPVVAATVDVVVVVVSKAAGENGVETKGGEGEIDRIEEDDEEGVTAAEETDDDDGGVFFEERFEEDDDEGVFEGFGCAGLRLRGFRNARIKPLNFFSIFLAFKRS